MSRSIRLPNGRRTNWLEACAQEEGPRYLIRDRDQVYGERFSRQAKTLDIGEVVIAPRSPWQNAYAGRVIGSIRRECLDHVVVIGERHLMRILSEVRRLLQQNADLLILDQGRARPTEGAAVEPGQGDGGAPRGWAPSRIPSESRVSRSDG
jgi:hypothetical protein